MKHDHELDQLNKARAQTFEDVLKTIEAATDFSRRQKSDLRSNINTFIRWVGKPASNMPATRLFVREAFAELTTGSTNVSKGRLANVRSSIQKVLECNEIAFRKRVVPLDPYWTEITREISNIADKRTLRKFARYCSLLKLSPDQVTESHSSTYLWHLEHGTLVANPKYKHQEFCRAWNRLVATNEDLDLSVLPVPKYRNGFGLPRDQFLDSFRADLDGYYQYLTNSDILSDHCADKPLREASAKYRISQAYACASVLVQTGIAIEDLVDLNFLVQIRNVRRILEFYYERHGREHTKVLSDTAEGLFKIAFRYVRVDKAPLNELRTFKVKVKFKKKGMTRKNRETLRNFNDPALVVRLKRLAFEEMDFVDRQLNRSPNPDGSNMAQVRLAHRYQKALAIMLLQHAPMRAKNLTNLHIDKHFNWKMYKGKLLINIPAEEVKNEEALFFELPEEATKRVRRYLDVYRPALLRGNNCYLFPGENGRAKSSNNFSQQLAKLTHERLGVRLTMHQFRHVMGKVFLDANPGYYEVLRRVLGHKSIETTIAYYAGEETMSALKHYQEAILADVCGDKN